MSNVYDNWERLVGAVIRREELWQMFHDRSASVSSVSSDFSSDSQVLDLPFDFSNSSSPPAIEEKGKSLNKSYLGRVLDMKVKRQDAIEWMSNGLLPFDHRVRIRSSYEKYLLIRYLPKDLSKDIMLRVCVSLMERVPIFKEMDERLMLETCDRLKSVLYTKDSFLMHEGDPVDEMMFIMSGNLLSAARGRTGYDNSVYLKGGDFCGEELFTWALDSNSTSENHPVSTRTMQAFSKVEAFVLSADDLKFVASQFRQLHGSEKTCCIYKFYSPQWRMWAACYIQAAWLWHYRKKLVRDKDCRLLDASDKGRISLVLLPKPAEPDFTVEETEKSLKKNYSGRVLEMKVKKRDAIRWMSYGLLPQNLVVQIKSYEKYLWIRNLPKDLSKDIMLHVLLAYLKRVPMFEKMDEQLLDAMCNRLKPVLYTKNSFIVREGDPVHEMLLIMRGKLLTVTTNEGTIGFVNSNYLEGGDFWAEELLTWALIPYSSSNLPISTRTVKALTEVEAFALVADDLKFVASQFPRLHSKQLRHTLRFYSQQWRTWAASFIQAAWRRYYGKKLEESLRKAENRLQDALVKGTMQTRIVMIKPQITKTYSKTRIEQKCKEHSDVFCQNGPEVPPKWSTSPH